MTTKVVKGFINDTKAKVTADSVSASVMAEIAALKKPFKVVSADVSNLDQKNDKTTFDIVINAMDRKGLTDYIESKNWEVISHKTPRH